MGGWLEIWRVKLVSTQVVVEVEVGVELGKNYMSCLFMRKEENLNVNIVTKNTPMLLPSTITKQLWPCKDYLQRMWETICVRDKPIKTHGKFTWEEF